MKTMEKGKSVQVVEAMEYVSFRMTWYFFHNDELDRFVRSLFRSVHNPNAKSIRHEKDFNGSALTSDDWFVVPGKVYYAVRDFAFNIRDKIKSLEQREAEIQPSIDKAVREQYDKIYNEGIERGRNLLVSLALDDISMSDLTGQKKEPYTPQN
ncbi:hypothetical protein [Lewinella sp. W8]|uniref:hypothetical protein n=1 Tax=Lewinella sp. W8 TaxID=2528208 RepID=UPI0010685A52|nr:hypothetical protein [Lewinella sp. W8]MTB53027.1 hypothetical protein [Lewinella sp. W8]